MVFKLAERRQGKLFPFCSPSGHHPVREAVWRSPLCHLLDPAEILPTEMGMDLKQGPYPDRRGGEMTPDLYRTMPAGGILPIGDKGKDLLRRSADFGGKR
jgi:hypothetical protein